MSEKPINGRTHWEGCEREHHDCAIALLEQCRAALAACEKDYAEAVRALAEASSRLGGMEHPALRSPRARRVLGGDIPPGYTVEDPVEQP